MFGYLVATRISWFESVSYTHLAVESVTIYLSSETFTVEPVITNIANSSPFSFTSLIPASVISFWAGAWVGAAVGSGVAVGSGAAVGSGVAVGSRCV